MIRKVERNNQRILVIDIRFRKRDGSKGRYRRDAQVQTQAAAVAEERRLVANIAQYGDVFEPAAILPEQPEATVVTFEEVVEDYRKTYMLTELKVSTRRGYNGVLKAVLLPRFRAVPITSLSGADCAKLDLELTKQSLAKSTRNNAQIVLRSVLGFAVDRQYVTEMPKALPRLRRPESSILEIPTDDEVAKILRMACETQRVAFAIMAYAGLRPNEVRALRCRDVKLRWLNEEPTGGFLSVREGVSHGEFHSPKTGTRELPITRALAALLVSCSTSKRERYVAQTKKNQRWGQYGLERAFARVRDRAGLSGWSVYVLRHYAITSWLRKGIPVHVVQKMAGHHNLETTQRYVHFLKTDLQDAALRLDGTSG
jgi:integrase